MGVWLVVFVGTVALRRLRRVSRAVFAMSYPDRRAKFDAWKVYNSCQCGFDEQACGAKDSRSRLWNSEEGVSSSGLE